MYCLVTVGTTEFDELVTAVLDDAVLIELRDKLHVDQLLIQFGRGHEPLSTEFTFKKSDNTDKGDCWSKTATGIEIQLKRFLPSLVAEMRRADVVISHAGAGTCLEALELRKPLVVVVNDSLADNHQTELAERLAADGHLLCTTPNQLAGLLASESASLFYLKSFERADPKIFRDFFYRFVGINQT